MSIIWLIFSALYLWNGFNFWTNRLEPIGYRFDRGNFFKLGLEFEVLENYHAEINLDFRHNVFIHNEWIQPDSLKTIPKYTSDLLFIANVNRTFLRDKSLKLFTGIGTFTYDGPPLTDVNKYIGSYTQYIMTLGLQYRKRIPSTNLLLGLTFEYFYTFKRLKESYPLEGFALFLDIGAVIKE